MNLKGMKKLKRMKFFSAFLIFFLVITFNIVFICANERETTLKEDLMILGIIKDGTGVYDTNIVNKQEMVTVLVRMLGKEENALNSDVSIPFTDVAKWNEKYVNYVYNANILKGTSETTFGGNEYFGINHAVTFMLRTLGYEDEKDFKWNEAYNYALEIGLLSKEDNLDKETFTRADMFVLMEKTLKFKVNDKEGSSSSKNEKKSLIRKLVDDKAYTEEKCNETSRFRFEEKKDNIVTEIVKKIKRSRGGEGAKVLTDIILEQKRTMYYGYMPDKDDIKVSAIYDNDYTKPKELTSDTNVTYVLDLIDKKVTVSYTEGDVTKEETIDIDIEWYALLGMRNFLVLDRDEANDTMLILDDMTTPMPGIFSYSDAEVAEAVSWEDSDLRYGLNRYNEIAKMLDAIDTSLDNGKTVDNVFILSAEELDRYLPEGGVYEEHRIAKNNPSEAVPCWLRAAEATVNPPIVTADGKISTAPSNATEYNDIPIGVRMACTVEDKEIEIKTKVGASKYFTKGHPLNLDDDFKFFINVGKGMVIPLNDFFGEDVSNSSLFSKGMLVTNIGSLNKEMNTLGTKTFKATIHLNGKTIEAEHKFEVINFEIGQEIEFGNYYQTSSTIKEPIKWIIIAYDEDKQEISLVSKDILDSHIFDTYESEEYNNSELDRWILNDFENEAFSFDEIISIEKIGIYENEIYEDEICTQEGNCNKAKATSYLINKGFTTDDDGYGSYWLDVGTNSDGTYLVDSTGTKIKASSNTLTNIGVRPTLTISSMPAVYSINGLEIKSNPYYLKGVPITKEDICVTVNGEKFDLWNMYYVEFSDYTSDYTSNLSSIDYNQSGPITINVSIEIDGETYTASIDSQIIDVGDVVTFAKYKEFETEDKTIYWVVSDIDPSNNRALFITRDVIDNIKYNDSTIESGSLKYIDSYICKRQYEFGYDYDDNEDFYIGIYLANGFEIHAPFALSEEEFNLYVPVEYRKAKPHISLEGSITTDTDGYAPYWLRREEVYDDNLTDYVDSNGVVAPTGKNITDVLGYRPAIWYVPYKGFNIRGRGVY